MGYSFCSLHLVGYDDNDEKLLKDFMEQGQAMMEAAGAKNIGVYDSKQAPGLDIHEMGGARMGSDPKKSLLNEWNQLHHCKNVFVTDGACMTSTGSQSPSILYMAFTARAVNYAAEQMKKETYKRQTIRDYEHAILLGCVMMMAMVSNSQQKLIVIQSISIMVITPFPISANGAGTEPLPIRLL